MAEHIHGADGDAFPLKITPSGTMPVAGQSGGVFHTLLTDEFGRLQTDITVGSVVVTSLLGSVAITTVPVPISGVNLLVSGAGTFGVSGTAFQTVWVGVGSIVVSGGTLGSVGISTNPLPVSGINIQTRGYITQDIIRKDSGSPAVDYVLADISRSIMIENLGSAIVYATFDDTTLDVTNSGTFIIPANDTFSADIEIGSVSIQSSGITSSEVQVIGIR